MTNAHDSLFGLYAPGASAIHRLPIGAKYLIVLGVSVSALALGRWWWSLAMLLLAVLALLGTGLPVRRALALPNPVLVLALVLFAYQALSSGQELAVLVVANLIACLFAVRILTLTTPAAALLEALAKAVRPLRFVGLPPERFALAVGVMLRSIPYLIGVFDEVGDAMRARGLARHPFARVTPVVVRSVRYAVATGEALAARGLGEESR